MSVGRASEWVRLIELATRRAPNPWRWRDIFYSRCQREADAFHLQWDKFLERGLFFIYLATYLSQRRLVPPSCTQTLWDKHSPLCGHCLCHGGGGTGKRTGHRRGNCVAWSKIWASGAAHRKPLFATMWECERKTVRTCRGGWLPLWDYM